MWAGNQTDLLRLLRLVEKRYESLLPDYEVAVTEHPRRMLQMSEAAKGRVLASHEANAGDAYWAARLAEVENDIEKEKYALSQAESSAATAGQIDMSLTGRKEERRQVSSSASNLVDYLDGRYINEVEFSAPSGNIRNHTISLRGSRSDGIYFRVSSTDAQWCVAAFAELSDEIENHVPAGRFIRNAILLGAFFFVASFVGLYYIGDTIALWTTDTGRFTGVVDSVSQLLLSIGTGVATMGGVVLTRRYIPAFEIARAGEPSRGRRVLNVILSSVGAVGLGVLGNVVSQAVMT